MAIPKNRKPVDKRSTESDFSDLVDFLENDPIKPQPRYLKDRCICNDCDIFGCDPNCIKCKVINDDLNMSIGTY